MNRLLLNSLLIFGSCAVLPQVFSQDKTVVRLGATHGIVAQNGRTWQGLDKQSKIMFLTGIQDGVTLLLEQLSDQNYPEGAQRALMDANMITGFRFSDIAKQVDVFYSDSANIRVPVIEAYKYSLLKMKGANNSDLEQVIVRLRQTYNQ
jgi:hypothetical protein